MRNLIGRNYVLLMLALAALAGGCAPGWGRTGPAPDGCPRPSWGSPLLASAHVAIHTDTASDGALLDVAASALRAGACAKSSRDTADHHDR